MSYETFSLLKVWCSIINLYLFVSGGRGVMFGIDGYTIFGWEKYLTYHRFYMWISLKYWYCYIQSMPYWKPQNLI